MIYTTQIVRLDGLTLTASVDDAQAQELGELKGNIRQVIKKLTPNSEPRASIESAKYSIQSVASHDASSKAHRFEPSIQPTSSIHVSTH
jgi:hypothetical protein